MQIPDDFLPDLEFAESKGWPREKAISEAQRFRDHALAKGRKARDWPAAWRNWVTSPFQQKPQEANGHGRRHGSVLDALDRLEERYAAGDDSAAGENGAFGLPQRRLFGP